MVWQKRFTESGTWKQSQLCENYKKNIENPPKSLDKFKEMKYNNSPEYKKMKNARRFAEYQYSELILSSPSWLKDWLYDYTADDTITITIDDVDYVYDKYAYNNIKHINEEIL